MAYLNHSKATDLSGKVGLITGGGTGLGLMMANGFAEVGVKVYIAGRRFEVLEKAAAAYQGKGPGSIIPLAMDVVDETSIKNGVKVIAEKEGRLDILVNNAGIVTPLDAPDFLQKKHEYFAEDKIPYELESFEGWHSIYKLNTFAPFFVTTAFLDLLEKGARSREGGTSCVINISSVAAAALKTVGPNASIAYATSKVALEQITLTIASDLASRRVPVRLNAIEPGVFPTEIVPAEFLEEYRTKPIPGTIAPVPLQRWGKPEELVSTALYLASTDYTNGIVLRVDGGFSLVNL